MTNEIKDAVMEAARTYLKQKGISQNELQRRSGVSYLSGMMKGVYTYEDKRAGKNNDISDKWFCKLAEHVGYKITRDYWPTVLTSQYKTVITEIKEAKENARVRMIIGQTGCGKSYAINKFVQNNPSGTYVIACSGQTCVSSLIRRLMMALNIDEKGCQDFLLDKISAELRDQYYAGLKPVLILDEAENLGAPALRSVKTVYDWVKDSCGIVLIGTAQLIKELEKLNKRDEKGIPQFYDRFKSGEIRLKPIDRTYAEFLNSLMLEPRLRDLIQKVCSSYRNLADRLELALRKADEKGVPLTEDFFRIIHNLPKEEDK